MCDDLKYICFACVCMCVVCICVCAVCVYAYERILLY